MNGTVTASSSSRHPELAEIRASRLAKADLRKTDIEPRVLVGRAIQRAASLVGWTLKELAGAVDRDPRQVARWIAGDERPHFDALFGVEELRQPLAQALAEMAGCSVRVVVEMETRRRG